MEFSGRLSAFPIGDLLQWAHNDQRTGALVIRRAGREKRIYFQDGEVVSCYSSEAAEFFGQHLLVGGLIDELALVKALTFCQKDGKRLGVALNALGILSPEVVLDALRRQIQDLVCDIFLWPHGIFYFEAELPPREELLPEALSSVALALEGARWLDELARIRRVFVHDNIVLGPGKHFPGERLSPLESRIVKGMRDQIALGDLYQLVRGSYFRFLQAAFGLAVREVLDVKGVGETPKSASREIHLADLLVEQAAEEQVLFFRNHLAFSLDLLDEFFPVWVKDLREDEILPLSERARELVLAIDGETSLGELVEGSRPERAWRLELIAELLRKGVLALLPMAASELMKSAGQAAATGAPGWWARLAKAASR